MSITSSLFFFFFFQAEDGIRDVAVTGVQTCALPISTKASILVAALPKAPLPPWMRPLCFLSAHPLKKATRSIGRSFTRSEERRVGKSVDLGGRRIIKKKKEQTWYTSYACETC